MHNIEMMVSEREKKKRGLGGTSVITIAGTTINSIATNVTIATVL